MLLIGSRAVKVHFPDARRARDWDVVVDPEEFERLSRRLGEPIHEPKGETVMFRHTGELFEVKRARHKPLWAAIIDRTPDPGEGEVMAEFPVLGECRVASPPVLLVLKQCYVAYPIAHWRKSLLDYHFLKERIVAVPPDMAEISRLGVEDAVKFAPWFEPPGEETLTCANPARQLKDPERHAWLHQRLSRGPTPLAHQQDAWVGFSNQPPERRRELMVELLTEEALVVSQQRLESQAEATDYRLLVNWALRVLITQYLPLAWRYFAADHYPQIQAKLYGARADWAALGSL